jgi:hypothetical protein
MVGFQPNYTEVISTTPSSAHTGMFRFAAQNEGQSKKYKSIVLLSQVKLLV